MVGQLILDKALVIPGWMAFDELSWLAEQATKCYTIVEFGSFHGRSTRALADNTPGKVIAVDPWNGDYYEDAGNKLELVDTFVYPLFKHNLEDHIESGKVVPIRGFSHNFKYFGNKVDMVFIDGDHRYKQVVRDIHKAKELLKDGGILCGHDYSSSSDFTWFGVKKAVDEIFGIDNIEVINTIWNAKSW